MVGKKRGAWGDMVGGKGGGVRYGGEKGGGMRGGGERIRGREDLETVVSKVSV